MNKRKTPDFGLPAAEERLRAAKHQWQLAELEFQKQNIIEKANMTPIAVKQSKMSSFYVFFLHTEYRDRLQEYIMLKFIHEIDYELMLFKKRTKTNAANDVTVLALKVLRDNLREQVNTGQLFFSWDSKTTWDILVLASWLNHIPIILWMIEVAKKNPEFFTTPVTGLPVEFEFLLSACKRGLNEHIEWAIRVKPDFAPGRLGESRQNDICYAAAKAGQYETLLFLVSKGYKWHQDMPIALNRIIEESKCKLKHFAQPDKDNETRSHMKNTQRLKCISWALQNNQ